MFSPTMPFYSSLLAHMPGTSHCPPFPTTPCLNTLLVPYYLPPSAFLYSPSMCSSGWLFPFLPSGSHSSPSLPAASIGCAFLPITLSLAFPTFGLIERRGTYPCICDWFSFCMERYTCAFLFLFYVLSTFTLFRFFSPYTLVWIHDPYYTVILA